MSVGWTEFFVGTLAGSLLVCSWTFVLWRRYVLLRTYRDRRAWAAFMLAFVLTTAAIAFGLQQLVSVVADASQAGLKLQFLLIGMGIGAMTWGGLIEALYLWRNR